MLAQLWPSLTSPHRRRRRAQQAATTVEPLEVRALLSTTNAIPLGFAPAEPDFSGTVKHKGAQHTVTLDDLDSQLEFDPTAPVWIVIHGRNQSANDSVLQQLAETIRTQTGEQVLLLDWGTAADSPGIGAEGEAFIKPVAKWAAKTLKQTGIERQDIHLVGYSWGALVAGEMSEKLKTVGSILAIDPARDHPLGKHYNPEKKNEINFARHALQSWAFFQTTDNLYASAKLAETAEEAFVVTGSDHFNVVLVVDDLLARDDTDPLAELLSLARLSNPRSAAPWTANSYLSSGLFDSSAGLFEAVIDSTLAGDAVLQLRYFSQGEQLTVP